MYLLFLAQAWPDVVDRTTIVSFLALSLGLPALGYFFMAIDIRAYLRALRGAMIVVTNCFPHLPEWARRDTPFFLREIGLQWPCTEEDVKRSYRRLAEALHPDRGGDRSRFLTLQRHFERSLDFVRDQHHR